MAKKRSYSTAVLQCSGLIVALATVLFTACSPRVATSFWRIGTEADSLRPGYAVLYEGTKMRHCYPVTEWTDSPDVDTYHQLHHHGVAVESELMAYRIYFDRKQTIDPYCKRTPQLELAQSHWYPNDSLLQAGYGDDILRVSGTVGVGSVKYWNGEKMVHIEPVAERSQRIVRQTRKEAVIEVAVKGWQVEGKSVDMTVQYTMRAGHRDMRCDVYLSDTVKGLCTGVQTIPAKRGDASTENSSWKTKDGILLTAWGTDWPVNDSVKYAKETVGLGVFIPAACAGRLVQDRQNKLGLLSFSPQDGLSVKRSISDNGLSGEAGLKMYHAHFYLTCCGATKENHPVATSAKEWLSYLRLWAKELR